MNIDPAIQHLQETANLLLPHGIYPGSYIGGHSGEFTETEWSAYGWNPNPQFPGDGTDASASPKPTWAELVAADAASRLVSYRLEASNAVDVEATRRIAAAYGARDVDHEIRIRLRGGHTEQQDADRVRLHAQHDRLQEWIADTSRTLAELESFDASSDVHWLPFTIELTASGVVTNADGRQVIRLEINATSPATFNLSYTNAVRVYGEETLEGGTITDLTSVNAGISSVWITRGAGASTERELAAEISVFASPYGVLNGAKTTVTFPAGG